MSTAVRTPRALVLPVTDREEVVDEVRGCSRKPIERYHGAEWPYPNRSFDAVGDPIIDQAAITKANTLVPTVDTRVEFSSHRRTHQFPRAILTSSTELLCPERTRRKCDNNMK
jgi:hypothetical protein